MKKCFRIRVLKKSNASEFDPLPASFFKVLPLPQKFNRFHRFRFLHPASNLHFHISGSDRTNCYTCLTAERFTYLSVNQPHAQAEAVPSTKARGFFMTPQCRIQSDDETLLRFEV